MTCCLGPEVQKEAAVKLEELIYMKNSWGLRGLQPTMTVFIFSVME